MPNPSHELRLLPPSCVGLTAPSICVQAAAATLSSNGLNATVGSAPSGEDGGQEYNSYYDNSGYYVRQSVTWTDEAIIISITAGTCSTSPSFAL